jgi:hypothetical protein
MTVKYGGRCRRLAKDVAPVAQLTSMGLFSQGQDLGELDWLGGKEWFGV